MTSLYYLKIGRPLSLFYSNYHMSPLVFLPLLCIFILIKMFFFPFRRLDQRQQYRYQLQRLQRLPENNRKLQAEKFYNLHLLYYNGVPDKYDPSGNKIKGVAPDHRLSIKFLERACIIANSPVLWLKLAGIHHHGMYNYDPDLELASKYYLAIARRFPHNNDARELYHEVQHELHNVKTHQWLNLPYKLQNHHHDKILGQLAKAPANAQTKAHLLTKAGGTAPRIEAEQLFRAPDPDGVRRNDMHNTHNSQVVSTVANSLRKLAGVTNIQVDIVSTIRQVRDYLMSRPDCDKTRDALKSLNAIERNIIPISSINMKEIEALNIVWNRIHSDDLAQNKDDLKESLYNQLADMQEHGSTVCPTGRIERIVDTLSAIDPNVEIKPTYVINEEMMNKAHLVQQSIFKEFDPERRKQLEAGTAPDQQAFDDRVKAEIRATLQRDYVDTGIMSLEKFTKNTTWIDSI